MSDDDLYAGMTGMELVVAQGMPAIPVKRDGIRYTYPVEFAEEHPLPRIGPPLVEVMVADGEALIRFPGKASIPVQGVDDRSALAMVAAYHVELGEEIARLRREMGQAGEV